MKRILTAALTAGLVLSMVGCGSTAVSTASSTASSTAAASTEASATEAYPAQKVILLCQNCRLFAPYLEKSLGVPVEVQNMGGSACWVGWSYIDNQAPKDGSYISYANFPNMITGYLDPTNTTGLDNTNFQFLEMFTSDINAIVAKPGETRFNDLESLIEYAKTNTVTVADAGARTDDAVCVAQLEKATGVQFQHVHFENTAGGMAAVQGGQVDVLVCNVSEATEPIESNAVTGLGVVDTKRSDFLPDLQCTGDLGLDISCSSSRGFICAQDMDENAKKLMCDALKAAMEDADLQAAAATAGVTLAPMNEDEFTTWVGEQNDAIRGIYDLLDQ